MTRGEWLTVLFLYAVVGGITAATYAASNELGNKQNRQRVPASEVTAAGALWPVVLVFTLIFGISRLSLRLLRVGPQLKREAQQTMKEAKGQAIVVSDWRDTRRDDYD